MSILSEILATKRTEVEWARRRVPAETLREKIAGMPQTLDFRRSLMERSGTAIIAEVKKASPSKGIIRENFDPVEIARTYAENGATCLSVLTDETYFKGKLAYLSEIRATVSLPLLRKDFMVDTYQLLESRAAGADAILLIVAALSKPDLTLLLQGAKELGLAALVEVHDQEELEEARDAGATFIGINNRDLHTFRTSLEVTIGLISDIRSRSELTIVSESAIFTRGDVEKLEAAGVDAVLVGESLMREADIAKKLKELLGE